MTTQELKEAAFSLGFIAFGVARPETPPFYGELIRWLASGRHGGMTWLEKNLMLRGNPAGLLEGCQAVVSLAYPYSGRKPCSPDGLCVSRYAEPSRDDYHSRLRELGKKIAAFIAGAHPGSRARICVDSAPLMERSLAMASGVGFIGKNTSLIVPGAGSFVYLCEILTTAPLGFTPPLPEWPGHCGGCTRCLDGCPSGALEQPYLLDASRCLSYLTIEKRDAVSAETGRLMAPCILGCDRCQEVCPHNDEKTGADVCLPPMEVWAAMEEEDFQARFGRTALARAGLRKLRENIFAVAPLIRKS